MCYQIRKKIVKKKKKSTIASNEVEWGLENTADLQFLTSDTKGNVLLLVLEEAQMQLPPVSSPEIFILRPGAVHITVTHFRQRVKKYV